MTQNYKYEGFSMGVALWISPQCIGTLGQISVSIETQQFERYSWHWRYTVTHSQASDANLWGDLNFWHFQGRRTIPPMSARFWGDYNFIRSLIIFNLSMARCFSIWQFAIYALTLLPQIFATIFNSITAHNQHLFHRHFAIVTLLSLLNIIIDRTPEHLPPLPPWSSPPARTT